MKKIVTKESLTKLLQTDNRAFVMHVIGKALVVLFNNQTAEEQSGNDVRVHNDMGFTGADGYSGCLTAKYYLKHGKLEDWQIDMWLKEGKRGMRIAKYHAQLNVAANAKAEKETA